MRLEKQEIRQKKVLTGLNGLSKKIRNLVTQKSELNQDLLVVQDRLKDISKDILNLETEAQRQKKIVRKHLSSVYRIGAQGLLRVMMTSNNPAVLDRNARLLSQFTKRDLENIKELENTQRELVAKREKFLERMRELRSLENEIKNKEALMLAQQEEKKKILVTIQKSRNFNINRIKQLRNQSESEEIQEGAEGILDFLSKPSFGELKGMLPTPVRGSVKIGFGLVRDIEDDTVITHKGLFLETNRNEPVVAVAEGTVRYAGKIDGFKNIVILDHGDHYYSVYGNLQRISVKESDEILTQGYIGETAYGSYYKEAGLYFEIRHFSEPFDPKPWLADFKIKVSSQERDL